MRVLVTEIIDNSMLALGQSIKTIENMKPIL